MGDSEKDHHYSGTSAPATGHHEESPVNIRRRLRDREMLKRKKEEAQEKDTYHEQTSSKRQRKTKGTGRGRRKQVKEPEPEPQPEPEPLPEQESVHELQQDPRQEEQHYETEAEKKPEFLSDLPQEHEEQEQEPEPLVHHEDPVPTVTEGETADVTLLIHEDDEHLPQETTSLLKDNEEEAVFDPAPATEEPAVLAFPLEQGQVEHQYYTPLL